MEAGSCLHCLLRCALLTDQPLLTVSHVPSSWVAVFFWQYRAGVVEQQL